MLIDIFARRYQGVQLRDALEERDRGRAEMPTLTDQQTEWAIEFSMSWIKSLIRRL